MDQSVVEDNLGKDDRVRVLFEDQRLIFENANVGILMLKNRQILRCNQRIVEMFGFSHPAELEGQLTSIFYSSPERYEWVGREGYSQLARNGVATLETELQRLDGSRLWVIQSGRSLDSSDVLNAPSIWVYTDITERKQADLALSHSEEKFSTAFDSCPLAASISAISDGRFLEVNASYERNFGWSKEDLVGKTSLEIGFWPDHESRNRWLNAIYQAGRLVDYETIWIHKSGERRHVSLSSEIIQINGQACILTYLTDISARKAIEADLKIAAAAFDSQEAVVITDANSIILRVNPAFTRMTGYTADEVVGKNPRFLKSSRHPPEFFDEMWESITHIGSWQGEIWDRRKNGDEYPKWLTISAVKDAAGHVTHYVGTHFDITERKKAEERIKELAYFDQLTGLPNRTSLHERLVQIVGVCQRKNRQMALMVIDLDNFKTINDTLGHPVGDQLLVQVANRLSCSVRLSDMVARLGGDEFVVILPDIDSPADAAHVADKVVKAISNPYTIDGNELRTSPSIGVCLYPEDATDIPELIKLADVAMYHAKAEGRGNYQFFREEIQSAAIQRLLLEGELRKAVERREFELHYQPQLDLRSGRLVGVEALIRWRHPERGLVSPMEFIPVAEDTGLILPIGDWVLEEGCRQLAVWKERGIQGIKMSLNLTASQFLQPSLPERILTLIRQYGVEGQDITLEITESMSMASPEQTINSMKELTRCGLSLSIDDFGTGYSSMAYLKMFPVSTLKIDRSFVKDIETDRNDAEICDVTVLLAHKLGMDVVAEGVETEAQMNYLISIGCDKIQGYFLSKPLPAPVAEDFLRNKARIESIGTVEVWAG